LAIVLAALFVAANRRAGLSAGKAALAALAWLLAYGALARSGVLARVDARPPPMLLVLPLPLIVAVVWAATRAGARVAVAVPLWALVGVQAFRLPLELAMHRAALAGIMPPQMSYGGLNYDIVTGATALLLAPLVAAGRAPHALVLAWNVMGSLLLLVVVGVAIAASPGVRAFGDGAVNSWVAYVPFVWLPSVLVAAASAGHVLVFRRLAATSPRATAAA
jgi:hypothetical protein